MLFKKILKILVDKIFQLILGRAGFWSGRLYDFILTDHSGELLENSSMLPKKWILVVGRDSYIEVDTEYPVGRLSDLKKIISNEPWRFPFKGPRFNSITRLTDHSHRVTSWVLKPDFIERLGYEPFWILPESVCFGGLNKNEVLEVNRLGQAVYVANTADGCVSSLGHKEAFLRQLGISNSQYSAAHLTKVLEDDTIAMLVLGVMHSLKAAPFRFFKGFEAAKVLAYPWARIVKLSVAISLSYLLLTSLYLLLAGELVDRKIASVRDSAELVVQMRQNIGVSVALANEMESILSNAHPMWVTWEIFLDLKDAGVSFRAINSRAPKVTFYVSAEKATDVLGMLSSHPGILDAEITQPVRQVGQEQQFAVRITLNPHVASKSGLGSNISFSATETADNSIVPSKVSGDE